MAMTYAKQVQTTITWDNGQPSLSTSYVKTQSLSTSSGPRWNASEQLISTNGHTTNDVIDFGAIPGTSLGHVEVMNLDATNYVDIGVVVSSTLHKVVRVRAQDHAVFGLIPGATYCGQANTASVLCSFRAVAQ